MEQDNIIVYSPPLKIIVLLGFGPFVGFVLIAVGCSAISPDISFSDATGTIKFLLPLFIIWGLLFLAYGKKIYLEENELKIKKLLIFCKERKIVYADISSVSVGEESTLIGATTIPRTVPVGILYLKLKHGKTMRLDLPNLEKSREFLEKLVENVNMVK